MKPLIVYRYRFLAWFYFNLYMLMLRLKIGGEEDNKNAKKV